MLKVWLMAPWLLLVGSFSVAAQPRFQHYSTSIAPYVVSPQEIVDRMLEIAGLKPGETLYDLGSGDGRILLTAAQQYRAKAVGVELSDSLVAITNEKIMRANIQNRARVIHGDLLAVDFSPADVVTIYLMTNSNAILRPNLEKYLRPGARVVSHEYAVPGWKAKYVEKSEPYARGHMIYLYVMPPAKR
jgi:ubiquinone/menaquinone biosynthesis C-methylase UbiE